MQDVPKEIEFILAEDQSDLKDLLNHLFNDPSLKASPKLDKHRLVRLMQRCEQYLLYKPKAFFPKLMSFEKYENLISESLRAACSVYWNEIDQYVFHFRIQMMNIIRSTILSFLKIENDPIILIF